MTRRAATLPLLWLVLLCMDIFLAAISRSLLGGVLWSVCAVLHAFLLAAWIVRRSRP